MKIKALPLIGVGALLSVGVAFLVSNSTEATYTQRKEVVKNSKENRLADFGATLAQRRADNDGVFKPELLVQRQEEIQEMVGLNKTTNTSMEFEVVGPNNIGGRTRALIIDKDNSNILYTGGVSGGLFKSTNAGGTWERIWGGFQNMAISSIEQGPDGTIYVGTGCSFDASGIGRYGFAQGAYPGGGIFKSTDGENFTAIPSTVPSAYEPGLEWVAINRIRVNPNNAQEIYAGTNRGLRVSTDGGQTWNNPLRIDYPSCNIPGTNFIDDIEIMDNGRVLVGHNGTLFISDNGTQDCSYVKKSIDAGIPENAQRIDIDFCDNVQSKVYVVQVANGGQLRGVYESDDAGNSFADLVPAPPSQAIDSTFLLFGDNGQGFYDLALEVYPDDPESFLIGGVETWRVSGSWSRVAENFFSYPFYVHSDKHFFKFDPNDGNTVYVTSDGGVGKSVNAKESLVFWTDNNRNYNTTQYYNIGFLPDGRVFGGTQDNGTHLIDVNNPGSAGEGIEIFGGDGYDAEYSEVAQSLFVTSYYGTIGIVGEDGTPGAIRNRGGGPFWTTLGYWESTTDYTSKDSVVFGADTIETILAKGNDATVRFTGSITKPQTVANPDSDAGSFVTATFSTTIGSYVADDFDGDGIVRDSQNQDSIGSIDYVTGNYDMTFPFAPVLDADIKASIVLEYAAGEELTLFSNTRLYPFTYTLPNDLDAGEKMNIQDPVQSILVTGLNSSTIAMTRYAAKDDTVILGTWFNLAGGSSPLSITGLAYHYLFTEDGDNMFVTTSSGRLYRFSGLNDVYTVDDLPNADVTLLYDGSTGAGGMSFHPNDPERLILTFDGYGSGTKVVEISNALSAQNQGMVNSVDVTGNLPGIPCYDVEYEMTQPGRVILGTDQGVWICDDISAGANAVWEQSATIPGVPAFTVGQQRLPWNEAANHEVVYIGTYGMGIWKSGSFVNSIETPDFESAEVTELKLYPNPVQGLAKLEVEANRAQLAQIDIYNVSGQLVRTDRVSLSAGTNRVQINGGELDGGVYIIQLSGETVKGTVRFTNM